MRRKFGAPCLPVQTAAQPPEPAHGDLFTGALPQKSLSNMFDKPTKFKKQIFSLCTHWGTDLKKILNSHLPRDKCTSLWYNICELNFCVTATDQMFFRRKFLILYVWAAQQPINRSCFGNYRSYSPQRGARARHCSSSPACSSPISASARRRRSRLLQVLWSSLL